MGSGGVAWGAPSDAPISAILIVVFSGDVCIPLKSVESTARVDRKSTLINPV